jgi:hypothetical protein
MLMGSVEKVERERVFVFNKKAYMFLIYYDYMDYWQKQAIVMKINQ